MARKVRQIRKLDPMMKSAALESIVMGFAEDVKQAASSDPNEFYVSTLDAHSFVTDRVVGQCGAATGIGIAVEAKRGTLARALGSIGA